MGEFGVHKIIKVEDLALFFCDYVDWGLKSWNWVITKENCCCVVMHKVWISCSEMGPSIVDG